MGLPSPSSSSSSSSPPPPPLLFFFLPAWALQNVTPQLFGGQAFGTLAAFGDFNSDKQTDLFVLRGDNELNIFLADQKEPYFKPKVKLPLTNVVITSVVPGDYDGDSQMDVLLTTRPQKQPNADLTVWIFWGKNQTLAVSYAQYNHFSEQCLTLTVINQFENRGFKPCFGNQTPSVVHVPYKEHFLHLFMIFPADLFLTTVLNDNQIQFEVWENQNGNFSKATHIKKKPKDAVVVGQSVFADFDGDGQTEHLLPACADEACQKSVIYLSKPGADQVGFAQRKYELHSTLGIKISDFPHAYSSRLSSELKTPRSLYICADVFSVCSFFKPFNFFVTGMENSAILHGGYKVRGGGVGGGVATFEGSTDWKMWAGSKIKSACVGILDILILTRNSTLGGLAIHALKNNFEADAYFVKVIVLSGLCSNDCPRKVTPFGVNQPGPYIMYTTVDANGYLKNGSAGQLSQSAHFALQLPYNMNVHLFQAVRKQEWTAIIPNSQLIVIPFPHYLPRSWSAKLYLTPSNIVLLTAIALIGVCVFILAIIGILHWQEKKADDREKRQEAHRFHFDAM
ncbi:hypothetical protein JRQ81_006139 [Phrynocephalus forsythii]|uniref:T-cell immunomodulatory protein TIP C2 domain-containing protein n=1 Tax=Phrynocephalus forsythii TaxID=171643 RepID=A0A9Q0XG50_9SAUR|nr:hypothetical protein JRQ81_006139 [Phrynocephalus forsythii]